MIIGAGYIGLEMVEALIHRGCAVTLISRSAPVFPTVDPAFGEAIEVELQRHGVRVVIGIDSADGVLRVHGAGDLNEEGALVLVAVGTRPETRLAREAGLKLGAGGAVAIDRAMRTSHPDIFAAGDCAETWHRVLGRNT